MPVDSFCWIMEIDVRDGIPYIVDMIECDMSVRASSNRAYDCVTQHVHCSRLVDC